MPGSWAFALTDNRARGVCGLVGPYSQFLVEPWRCERVELEASLAAHRTAPPGGKWWGYPVDAPPVHLWSSREDMFFSPSSFFFFSRCNVY